MISNRRFFLKSTCLLGAGSLLFGIGCNSKSNKYFFSLKKRNGRWWLIDPSGNPFWSIGINHVDPASLRYSESVNVWNERYSNSMKQWLTSVKKDLLSWGFNTLGWNQEVVTINDQHHRHSRSFTFEEYQWLDMPYCHLLPFIESHQWENETRLPDIESNGFAEWCDYVARDQCARMKDDPNLVGYFYTDCPTFVHNRKENTWKGTLFDPMLLKTDSGRKELKRKATVYYKVLHDSIRRYDKNHLIFGDRYEAQAPLPEDIIDAAAPYIDVYSFQCFGGPEMVKEKVGFWADYTKKPVLLADSAVFQEPYKKGWPAPETRHHSPEGYKAIHEVCKAMPGCIGFHLCGAYIENDVRRYGLKNKLNQVDIPYTNLIKEQNEAMMEWVRNQIE